MALQEMVHAGAKKKEQLLDNEMPRFFVRAILAGIYLTAGTAFAAVAGNAVNEYAPGLGSVVFALLFGLGLFAIVILNAELATGDMMFASWAATDKVFSWGKGIWLVVVVTVANLIGAIIFAAVMSQSAKFGSMDNSHLIVTLVEGKLAKPFFGALLEAIFANFIVNMAIVGALLAKEFISKFVVILPLIAIFVGLGLEHVIANFSLFSLAFLSSPLPEGFTATAILSNWVAVWIGNFIGGGLCIGGGYAWLNKTKTGYKD